MAELSTTVSRGTVTEAINERIVIDRSARTPVLVLFGTAVLWLLAMTALGFVATFKLHQPGFLADWPFLTFGRIWPAYLHAFLYGWASLSGMGVALWIISRLCRVRVTAPGMLVTAALAWNVAVVMSVLGILGGANRGWEFLEMPAAAAVVQFISFSIIAIWAVVMFQSRREGPAYVSLWYLVSAFIWFAWLFAAANVMLALPSVRGVVQAAVVSWYGQGLLSLWFTSIGLAAIYYLIPKVLGTPIHSYNLAAIGFWGFAFLAPLTAMNRLSGGPVPVWMVTLSVMASLLMVIPVATVTLNYVLTMRGHNYMVYHSPTIRFTYFGAIAFTFSWAVTIFGALRSVAHVANFTLFNVGQLHLVAYAFFTMTMFGAIYYILPRLTLCEWFSATFIRLHFWACAYGIGFAAAMLLIGGMVQGGAWANLAEGPVQVGEQFSPYLIGCTIFWLMLAVGHGLFAFHFVLMLMRLGEKSGRPTMLAPLEERVTEGAAV
jgi:cytochrome c oxidase cbb3-type subunit 1